MRRYRTSSSRQALAVKHHKPTIDTGHARHRLPKKVCARPVLPPIASRKSRIKLYLRNAISLHRKANDYKKNALYMTTVIMTLSTLD